MAWHIVRFVKGKVEKTRHLRWLKRDLPALRVKASMTNLTFPFLQTPRSPNRNRFDPAMAVGRSLIFGSGCALNLIKGEINFNKVHTLSLPPNHFSIDLSWEFALGYNKLSALSKRTHKALPQGKQQTNASLTNEGFLTVCLTPALQLLFSSFCSFWKYEYAKKLM